MPHPLSRRTLLVAALATAGRLLLPGRDRPLPLRRPSMSPGSIVSLLLLRGTDSPVPNPISGGVSVFTTIVSQASANGVPLTLVLRYDALTNGTYASALTAAAAAGHEPSVWLEITPGQATAAGVTYNMGGSIDFGACRCMLLGYSQADRKKLIDTQFAAFFTRFGHYPTSIHTWMIDTYSAQYCRDTYGVSTVSMVRDQTSTDAYDVQGGPENTIWEASATWLLVPASRRKRSNLAVFRAISVDLLNNFGSGATVYTTEPADVQANGTTIGSQFTPLLTSQLATDSTGAGPFVCVFYDGDLPNAGYTTFTGDALAAQAAFVTGGSAVCLAASAAGNAFLAASLPTRDRPRYLAQSSDPDLGSNSRCLVVATARYKARIRYDSVGTYLGLTDLRSYAFGPVDPYFSTICPGQNGVQRVPWLLDGAHATLTGTHTAYDTPANSPLVCGWTSIDGATTLRDFAVPTATATLTAISVPSGPGRALTWLRSGAAADCDFLPGGLRWGAWQTVANTGALLFLEFGVSSADTLDEYIGISGVETHVSVAGAVALAAVTSGVQYLALVWPSGAAVLLYPLAVTGGTVYGATGAGVGVRLGVSASAAGAVSAQIAVVPTSAALWRATLAALLADPYAVLQFPREDV